MQTVKILFYFILPVCFFCIPSPQTSENRPGAPHFDTVDLTVLMDRSGVYYECVYLKWLPPADNSTSIHYYALLRKFPGDSLFDVFALSTRIPSTINEFHDRLDASDFPTDAFDSLCYKIYSVDSHGRLGDTSQASTLIIAPQPSFDTLDQSTQCLRWSSWIRGSQTSFLKVWTEASGYTWVSNRIEAYPRTDEPAIFSACVTDTALKLNTARLYFALFLQISEARSIRTGFLDIP